MSKFPVHRLTSEPALSTITKNLKEMWPFAAGFAFTGYIMVSIASSVTDEDVKASKFATPKH